MSQAPPERPEDQQPEQTTPLPGQGAPSTGSSYPYAPQSGEQPAGEQPPAGQEPQPWGAPQGGQTPPPSGQPPYGAPQQPYGAGGQPPGYGYPAQPYQGGYAGGPVQPYQGGYPAGPGYGYTGAPVKASPTPTSTIVLLVVSGLTTLSCYFSLVGIVPLILGIVALSKAKADEEGCRRLTRIGWIVYAVVGVIGLLLVIAAIGFFAISESGSSWD